MTYIQPYLRSQDKLLADIRADNYTAGLGWTDAQVYRAIDRALRGWGERVRIARLYTISGGWVAGTYSYDLPSYIRPPYTPELQRTIPYDSEPELSTSGTTWQPLPGWTEEPDSDGTLVLRVTMRPYTLPGRIVWYAPNGRIDTTGTLPTTAADITATATSVTLTGSIDVDDTGWLKIGDEFLFYAGKSVASSITTLSNLQRAQYNSAAATHASGSTVAFCVAADNLGLYDQLLDQAKAYLHAEPLVNTTIHETGRHERLMQFYQQKADEFWRRYRPQTPGLRMVLDRKYLFR